MNIYISYTKKKKKSFKTRWLLLWVLLLDTLCCVMFDSKKILGTLDELCKTEMITQEMKGDGYYCWILFVVLCLILTKIQSTPNELCKTEIGSHEMKTEMKEMIEGKMLGNSDNVGGEQK